MSDMLVKLFNISISINEEEKLLTSGIRIKRAFANNPITCYIATKDKELIGFCMF